MTQTKPAPVAAKPKLTRTPMVPDPAFKSMINDVRARLREDSEQVQEQQIVALEEELRYIVRSAY